MQNNRKQTQDQLIKKDKNYDECDSQSQVQYEVPNTIAPICLNHADSVPSMVSQYQYDYVKENNYTFVQANNNTTSQFGVTSFTSLLMVSQFGVTTLIYFFIKLIYFQCIFRSNF
jgi:hypothetical protein